MRIDTAKVGECEVSHDSLPCGLTLRHRGKKGEKPQNVKVATVKARYCLLYYNYCLPTRIRAIESSPGTRVISSEPHVTRWPPILLRAPSC